MSRSRTGTRSRRRSAYEITVTFTKYKIDESTVNEPAEINTGEILINEGTPEIDCADAYFNILETTKNPIPIRPDLNEGLPASSARGINSLASLKPSVCGKDVRNLTRVE